LHGVLQDTFTVGEATGVYHNANSGEITVYFPPSATTVFNTTISGVTPPKAGATPVLKVKETTEFRGDVEWYVTNGSKHIGPFNANTSYTAKIVLDPKTGYTFYGVEANSFFVSGAINKPNNPGNAANSGVVTVEFPVTEKTVQNRTIYGIPVPVAWNTKPTINISTPEYTGYVYWTPDEHNLFSELTVYTANISLYPSQGYTFYGVAANSFTVDGYNGQTNAANSGYIEAVYPITGTYPGILVDSFDIDFNIGSFSDTIATFSLYTDKTWTLKTYNSEMLQGVYFNSANDSIWDYLYFNVPQSIKSHLGSSLVADIQLYIEFPNSKMGKYILFQECTLDIRISGVGDGAELLNASYNASTSATLGGPFPVTVLSPAIGTAYIICTGCTDPYCPECGHLDFGGGTGTYKDPFLIMNYRHLRNTVTYYQLSQYKHFRLENDIDLSAYGPWDPINGFYGYMNGNNYTISGLTSDVQGNGYISFGIFCTNIGTIKDLKVSGSISIPYNRYGNAGFLAGWNWGTVNNVTVLSGSGISISHDYIYAGGICGSNGGTIKNCTNYAGINGTGYMGGIAGRSEGAINTCTNYGNLSYCGFETPRIGGICGWQYINSNASTTNSTNWGEISYSLRPNSSITLQPCMGQIIGGKSDGTVSGNTANGYVNTNNLSVVYYNGGVHDQALYAGNREIGQ